MLNPKCGCIYLPRSVFVGPETRRSGIQSIAVPVITGFSFCKKDHSDELENKKTKLFLFRSLAKGFYRSDNDGASSHSPAGILQG